MDEVQHLTKVIHHYSRCHEQCSSSLEFLRALVNAYEQHHQTCNNVVAEKRMSLDQELESLWALHNQSRCDNPNGSDIIELPSTSSPLKPNGLEIVQVTFTASPRNKGQPATVLASRHHQKPISATNRTPNSDRSVTEFEEWETRRDKATALLVDVAPPATTTREKLVEYYARETVAWIQRATEVSCVARLHLFCFLSYCVVLEEDGMDSDSLNNIMKLVVGEGTAKYLKSLRTNTKQLHQEVVLELVDTGWSFSETTLLFYLCGPLSVSAYTYYTSKSRKDIVEKVKNSRPTSYDGHCVRRYISTWDPSLSFTKVHHALYHRKPKSRAISNSLSPEELTSNTPLRLSSRNQSALTSESFSYVEGTENEGIEYTRRAGSSKRQRLQANNQAIEHWGASTEPMDVLVAVATGISGSSCRTALGNSNSGSNQLDDRAGGNVTDAVGADTSVMERSGAGVIAQSLLTGTGINPYVSASQLPDPIDISSIHRTELASSGTPRTPTPGLSPPSTGTQLHREPGISQHGHLSRTTISPGMQAIATSSPRENLIPNSRPPTSDSFTYTGMIAQTMNKDDWALLGVVPLTM